MQDKRYIMRSVPLAVDSVLRDRAKQEGKSLNVVAIEAMERGLGLAESVRKFTDLDHLIGTWEEDPEFDRAMKDFERIDEDMWK